MPRLAVLLVALNSREVSNFLPAGLRDQIESLADRVVWFDPTGLEIQTWRQTLQDVNPDVLVGCWSTPPLPAELPPRLRYVCYLPGSVRKLLTREHIENGLIVTDWGNSVSRFIAEAALLHILSCLRRAPYWIREMHERKGWKTDTAQTATLFDRPVGIRGFGRIARELVKLLAPFRCPISVFAPDFNEQNAQELDIIASPSLDSLFRDNDIVVELAPLNDETRQTITEKHLRLLSPGNVFVNVGRAETVDEAALLKVAAEGEIFFGLDVFHLEPLPAEYPLRALSNVCLSPHNAGPTTDGRSSAGAFALQNLQAYLKDTPLNSVITPAVYDRST
jgi:phosphoglycerate dehydrogenase-like enzyme